MEQNGKKTRNILFIYDVASSHTGLTQHLESRGMTGLKKGGLLVYDQKCS